MTASAAERSPVRVTLADLMRLRPAGEALRLTAPRVRAASAGGHLSPYKGRGIEYDESRPYQPGDDLRTIDWRVTARTGKPHTKVFREERNRPVFVCLDLRRPMMFATRGAFKGVRGAEITALVAWAAIANGDRLGGVVFSEAEHRELRPALGVRAALRLMKLVADDAFWSRREERDGDPLEAEAEHALERLTRVVRPGSIVFFVSDFRGIGTDAERHLRELAGHSDVFLVHVFDPLETELPPPGRYRIQGAGRTLAIETGDAAARARYRQHFEARTSRLRAMARRPGIHLVECRTVDEPRVVLAQHFRNA
ncbi:MAG TPA: DUF58 domain-containing protein [Gammaproteobacteria bacterium]